MSSLRGAVRIGRAVGAVVLLLPSLAAAQRAVLGMTLGPSSALDTAGVRVDTVEPAGPAARAGIRAGDVLVAIQGTPLRLSGADAQDPSLWGVPQRRLQRALAAVRPGDTVRVDVRTGTSTARLLRVGTTTTEALAEARRTAATTRSVPRTGAVEGVRHGARRVIGVVVGSTGSRRDTVGLFVSQVTPNGPAERAGLVEGDRIAAMNGVDLRVPAEDIEDPAVGAARANRFVRAIAEADSGRPVQLQVVRAGQPRDIRVVPEPETIGRTFLGQRLDPEMAVRLRLDGQRLRDSLEGWRLRFEQELPALIERATPRLELRMSPPILRRGLIII
ncbi:MAG: hypothetical protein RLZZ621_1736 [Gemmatimonadota bacterium]